MWTLLSSLPAMPLPRAYAMFVHCKLSALCLAKQTFLLQAVALVQWLRQSEDRLAKHKHMGPAASLLVCTDSPCWSLRVTCKAVHDFGKGAVYLFPNSLEFDTGWYQPPFPFHPTQSLFPLFICQVYHNSGLLIMNKHSGLCWKRRICPKGLGGEIRQAGKKRLYSFCLLLGFSGWFCRPLSFVLLVFVLSPITD